MQTALERLMEDPAKLAKWYNVISLVDLEDSPTLMVTVLRRVAMRLNETVALQGQAEALAIVAETIDQWVKRGGK